MWRKCKIIITFVRFNIFLKKTAETCNKAVMRITHAMNGSTEGSILVSHIKLDVCSSLTLIHWMHANMAGLVKLREVFQKYYSISWCDESPVFKKKTKSSIHVFYTWWVSLKHKIICQQSLISVLIYREYVLRIPKVLLPSNNPKVLVPGRSSKSCRMASLWCCAMARHDSKSFLTIWLISFSCIL